MTRNIHRQPTRAEIALAALVWLGFLLAPLALALPAGACYDGSCTGASGPKVTVPASGPSGATGPTSTTTSTSTTSTTSSSTTVAPTTTVAAPTTTTPVVDAPKVLSETVQRTLEPQPDVLAHTGASTRTLAGIAVGLILFGLSMWGPVRRARTRLPR